MGGLQKDSAKGFKVGLFKCKVGIVRNRDVLYSVVVLSEKEANKY